MCLASARAAWPTAPVEEYNAGGCFRCDAAAGELDPDQASFPRHPFGLRPSSCVARVGMSAGRSTTNRDSVRTGTRTAFKSGAMHQDIAARLQPQLRKDELLLREGLEEIAVAGAEPEEELARLIAALPALDDYSWTAQGTGPSL